MHASTDSGLTLSDEEAQGLLSFLPSIALFGGLEAPTLRRVVAELKAHEFQPGQSVCREGEPGRAMFILRRGEVIVCRQYEDGTLLKMVRLGPGEFFGEMTLIDPQKRSATVLVEQPSRLYSLSAAGLFKLYSEDVPGYVLILQNLCRELSRRLRSTNARLQAMAEELHDHSQTLIQPKLTVPPPRPGK